MKSFVKKTLIVLVICVVLNHFTEINISGMVAEKIDELTNSTYATEFIGEVQKRAEYLIDNFEVQVLRKEDDKLSFEVTVGLPDANQDIAETTETPDNMEKIDYVPETDNSPVDDITTENDSVSGNPQDSLEGQVSKYIHLVMTAGQTVLEEMEE